MRAPIKLSVCSFLFAILSSHAQSQPAKTYLISVQQNGKIQFRDPETLDVRRSIQVNLPEHSTGLSGVRTDPLGTTLYLEGPTGNDIDGIHGCCRLYALELLTGKSRVVADIWGTESRARFMKAGASILASVSPAIEEITKVMGGQWEASPDGLWRAGVRDNAWVDLLDGNQQKVVSSIRVRPEDSEDILLETWVGDELYLYSTQGGSASLWHLSPKTTRLDELQAVRALKAGEDCPAASAQIEMDAIGDKLLFYEVFGGTIDRRDRCRNVDGGAWIVDPTSGRTVTELAPEFHFWSLIPSRDGTSLYGITANALYGQQPSELVRIDASTGKPLKLVPLEAGYWFAAFAPLRSIPEQDLTISLPEDTKF